MQPLECLPFIELSQVHDHHRDNQDEQDDSDRGGASGVILDKTLHEEFIRDHVGTVVTAGHGVDHIKCLQREDQHRRRNGNDGIADDRDDDLEEDLDFICAVNAGSFEQFGGNALDRGGQDDHAVTGLQPDHDDDKEDVVPERDLQPGLRLSAQRHDDGIEQTGLISLTTIVVDEFPDHTCTDEGDSHRQEDDDLVIFFCSSGAVSQNSDQQTEDHTAESPQDQP